MIINESLVYQVSRVRIMGELAITAALAKSTFIEIAKQASALASGLQNAAPSGVGAQPNKSIQYLQEASQVLSKSGEECEQFLTLSSIEQPSLRK